MSTNKDWIYLYEVKFEHPRKQIGDCHFSSNGEVTTELVSVAIMRHKDDSSVYLLYEFVNGVNDSYLESVEAAMEEAEEQFGIKRGEWIKLNS